MKVPDSSVKRKILILTANPKDSSPLRLNEELRRITDALERSKKRSDFDIHTKTAISILHLRRAILDCEPEIIHFCGHGAGKNGIVVEDQLGQSKLIPTKALADLFELTGESLKCVVLNACYAEFQAKEIVKHINYVVGMKHAIGDEAAINFSEGFYDALGAGKDFPVCFKYGKNSIALEDIPEDLIPTIKVKSDELKSEGNNNSDDLLKQSSQSKKKVQSKDLASSKIKTIPAKVLKKSTSENSESGIKKSEKSEFHKEKIVRYITISILVLALSSTLYFGLMYVNKISKISNFSGYYAEQKPEEYNKRIFRMQADGTGLIVYFDHSINKFKAVEYATWEVYYPATGQGMKIGGYSTEWTYVESTSSSDDVLIMDGKFFRRLGKRQIDEVLLQNLPPEVKIEYNAMMYEIDTQFVTANSQMRLDEAKHIKRTNIYNGDSKPDESFFIRQN